MEAIVITVLLIIKADDMHFIDVLMSSVSVCLTI